MNIRRIAPIINLCIILFMLFFALAPAGAVFAQEELPPDPTAELPVDPPSEQTGELPEIVVLEGGASPMEVRFCPGTAGATDATCVQFPTIDLALAHAQALVDGTGTIFVSSTLIDSTPSVLIINENAFLGGTQNIQFSLLGGYDFSTGLPIGQTTLLRPVSIANFSDSDPYTGGFSLMNFLIETTNMHGIHITNTDNLILENLDVSSEATNWDFNLPIYLEDVNNVQLTNLDIFHESSVISGNPALAIYEGANIEGEHINITTENRGLDIYEVDTVTLDQVNIQFGYDNGLVSNWNSNLTISNLVVEGTGNGSWSAYFAYTSGNNVLRDSIVQNAWGDGIALWSGPDSGRFDLINVTSSNNGTEDPWGLGRGVEIQSGAPYTINILNSHFDNNTTNIRVENEYVPLNLVIENSTFNGGVNSNIINYGDQVGYLEITNSEFNQNQGNGLETYSGGNVRIYESTFNDNLGFGLWADADSMWLECIQANDNGAGEDVGARLEAEVAIDISCSEFNNNRGAGLYAWAPAITYSNITATGNTFDQIYWETQNLTEVIGKPCNCSWCGSSGGTSTGSPALPSLPAQVILVYTDPGSGSAQLLGDNTTIFKLMEEQPQPPDKELARITLVTGVAPTGSLAVLTYKSEMELPGSLPAGSEFIGPAFEFTVTEPDGNTLSNLSGNLELRFTLPEGGTVPADMEYAILHFDASSGEWVQLDTTISSLYAYAYTAQTGIFTLALVPVP